MAFWALVGTGQRSSRVHLALILCEVQYACGCLSRVSLLGGMPVESPRGWKGARRESKVE